MADHSPSDLRPVIWTSGAALLLYYVLFAGGGLQIEPDREAALRALAVQTAAEPN